MRLLLHLLSAFALFVSMGWSDEGHHQHALTHEELGSVYFSMSCSNHLERVFDGAVALLHSFQYEQARQVFAEISRQDSKCAMAWWGIAMSHYHGLWDNGDTSAGRDALHKAQEVAAANSQTTSRERAYLDALAEIYRDDGRTGYDHARAFEQKMGALQAAYPSDNEAAIFHALTLAITAPKTDKTFAHQRECGEILEPIFEHQPQHPGVVHYLIHCYDNPSLAEKGLLAARTYARIAPASAHANHMPSHIFTRVGSWAESIASNLKSAELAEKAERSSTNGEARDQRLHAMDYLEYAYLQSGRVKQAQAVFDQMNALQQVPGLTLTGDYALAAIPARYAIELENWNQASGLKVRGDGVPWAQAITWTALGIGSARSGNVARALEAEKMLVSLRDASAKQNDSYWSNQVEVQRREVASWVAKQSGKGTDAIAIMRGAAELEESMDKHAVTPGPVTPAREMLAQLLSMEGQSQEAVAEYENALKLAPNRFNALYGAACAAEAAGKASVAHMYFLRLIEIAVGDERPELVTARRKVAVDAQSALDPRP